MGIQASKGLVCPAVIILDFESRGDLGMVQSSINRGVIRQKIGLGGGEGKMFPLQPQPSFLWLMHYKRSKLALSLSPTPPKMRAVQVVFFIITKR